MKPQLFLTCGLFLFVQISAPQAQETLDLAKITCQQFVGEQLQSPSRDVLLLLVGYYNGKRNNTIIEPNAIKADEDKVYQYCYAHTDMTVMDAVKNLFGFDK